MTNSERSTGAALPAGDGEFYRCSVTPEVGSGRLRVGRRRIDVQVCEASIDGFSVVVAANHAAKLRLGQPWTLRHGGAILEVHPQWLFHAPDGNVQVGLRRLRDLTPLPKVGGWHFPRLGSVDFGSSSVIAAVAATVVGVVATLLIRPDSSLPQQIVAGFDQGWAIVANWLS